MKYVVQGQNRTYTYKINSNKDDNGSFTKKPEIVLDKTEVSWGKILNFECDHLEFNTNYYSYAPLEFNISKNEKIRIENKIFRADLAITYLHSNKILSDNDNKKELQDEYNKLLEEYCNYICNKYPEVKRHCEIYNIKFPIEEIDDIVNKVRKYEPCISVDKHNFYEINSSDFLNVLNGISDQ